MAYNRGQVSSQNKVNEGSQFLGLNKRFLRVSLLFAIFCKHFLFFRYTKND